MTSLPCAMGTGVRLVLACTVILITQSRGCLQDLNSVVPTDRTSRSTTLLGGAIYYLDTLAFTCSGEITGYSLKVAFDRTQFWMGVVNGTVGVIRGREEGGLTRVGEFNISMDRQQLQSDSDTEILQTVSGELDLADRFQIQVGDYLRISLPDPVYDVSTARFVSTHLPVAALPDSRHSVEHFYGCVSTQQCQFRSADAVRVLIDLRTHRGPSGVTSEVPAQTNTGGWIAAVITLLLVIAVLAVTVVIVVFRKKLQLLTLRTVGEGHIQAVFRRKGATVAASPPHPTPGGSPCEDEEGGTLPCEYATIGKPRGLCSPPVPSKMDHRHLRAPDGAEGPYDLPLHDSNSLLASIDSTDNRVTSPFLAPVKYCYVPTREQRLSLSNVQHCELYESLRSQQRHMYTTTPLGEVEVYSPPSEREDEIYQQMAERRLVEIPHSHIQLTKKIGEGEFGEVLQGVWESLGCTEEVAVKVVKKGSSEKEKIKLLQEAATMGQFNHPRVVKLFGVLTLNDPIMIVLELLTEGDLRNHLMNLRENEEILRSPTLPNTLLRFSHQIVHGMDYLSRRGFVHRDLAARNILLGKDFTCKISDFGMSRDITGSNYYTTNGGRVPVKWTAPEAILYCKYSTSSDVWSYGMLMYEIWSVGWKPFDSFSIDQVINIINTGYCQPPPPGTPRAIYTVMAQCWNPEPRQRPSFPLLYATLGQSEPVLLAWTEEDRETAGEEATLGAALIEGLEMFPELQFMYRES